jgi:opacity protein-like surface antigen
MKKSLVVLSVVLLVPLLSFGGDFSLRLSGGAATLMGGDFNKAQTGIRDYVNSIRQSTDTFSDNLKKLGWGGQFEAEFLYEFNPGFSFGLSAGYLTASVTSGFTRNAYELMLNPSLSVVPVLANLHWAKPLGAKLNLHLAAGAGPFITKVTYDYRETFSASSQYSGTYKPKGSTVFGAQAGAGLEMGLTKNVFLTLDVKGRYAQINKLTGSWSGTYYGSPRSGDNATLYVYEYDGKHTLIGIWDKEPSGVHVQNVREASISMSGVVGLVGLRIAL